MKKENIALVLSGGGARGMAHIGVLKILDKNGISPNIIIGTSAGAMVGGLYAAGKLKEFEDILTSKSPKEIRKIIPFRPSKEGLISLKGFEKELRKIIDNIKIENLNKKFVATAVDLLSGKKLRIDKGDLCEAIIASCTIPLLFPPLKKENMLLVDGGLENPLAIKDGFELAKKVIAVSIERDIEKMPKKENYNFLDIAERSLIILQKEIVNTSIKKYKKNLVVLKPEVNINTLDFHKAKEAIEIGEKEAENKIKEIKKLIFLNY